MAVVFTDPFTVGADQRLNARTGYVRVGGNGSSTSGNTVLNIEAATDDIEVCTNGGIYEIVRCNDASMPTGDQQVTLDLTTGSNSQSHAGAMLRCPTSNAESGYQLRARPAGGWEIQRGNAGSYTLLASGGTSATSTSYTGVVCRATGTGSVLLEIEDNLGNTLVSYTDSSASRHDSGTPGLGGYNEGGAACRIDNFEVDDLSSGGGTMLVVDDALHGHTADSPALTQASTLSVDSATHGHSADSLALTQANVLAVQEALHGHTADSLTLVQAAVLAIAEALHGHTADSPALSVAFLLVVQDAAHGHAADSLALTQAHVLAVQDALHALFSDSPFIGDLAVLSVDDATHALASDEIVLVIVEPAYEGWTGTAAPLSSAGDWGAACGSPSAAGAWAAACLPEAVTGLRFVQQDDGDLYLTDSPFLATGRAIPLVSGSGGLALDDTASSGLSLRKSSSGIAAYET